MAADKKLLFAYPLKGDAAKIVFAGRPDVAKKSGITEPEKGIAVLTQDEGDLEEMNTLILETLKLMQAGVVEEFAVNVENIEDMIEQAVRLIKGLEGVLELTTLLETEEEDEDEDDDAE